MDNIDLKIVSLLIDNSRVSYSKLAKSIGISINTLRNRIKRMLDNDIIRYKVFVDATKFGFDIIYLLLHTYESIDLVKDRLETIGKIGFCMKCLGDVYIITLLVYKLNNVEKIVRVMLEGIAIVKIILIRQASPIRLSKNKLRVIRYLISNPKAKNKEIAEGLNISTKTVKRIIDNLVKNNVIRFSLILNMAMLKGYINFGIIIIDSKVNKIINRLYPIIEGNFLIPPIIYKDILVLVLYTDTIYKIEEIYKEIKGLKPSHTELLILLDIEYNTDWIYNVNLGS